jgi:16S rRNA A1518/A1519 N6-dimethyltransferase RsmA/KsgA/DIM1 with predicted DNA glycosylase/AP lyase activity
MIRVFGQMSLRKKITDWPTEYHFSRQRHCLLRPLNIQAGEDVLELGCGCGAMTRYLGEIGAIVDSIEGLPLALELLESVVAN